MKRPTLEVADHPLRGQGLHRTNPPAPRLATAQGVAGHPEMSHSSARGHLDQCSRCGHRAISFFSCRNRHCPKCQTNARNKWLAARSDELIGVSYFHVVFTLPHELSALAIQNKRAIYDLLFRASAATLLEVAADPKHLGAEIGFLSDKTCKRIPTCTASFQPAVFRQTARAGFIRSTPSCWPVKVLSRVFRGKFVAGLKCLYRRKKLGVHGNLIHLSQSRSFRAFLRKLFRQDWVVYAKPPFGGPEYVLQYLARYTHRSEE